MHSITCNPLASQSIERKHLIADYNQRDSHTTTTIHHAQSDFIEAATLKVQQRFPSNRNSIVPLMQQQEDQQSPQHLQQLQQQQQPQQSSRSIGRDGCGGDGGNVGHTTRTTSAGTCSAPSPIIFLATTLFATVAATTLICLALMSDHWELIRWDRKGLDRLTHNNSGHLLHWHLDERVARMSVSRKCFWRAAFSWVFVDFRGIFKEFCWIY